MARRTLHTPPLRLHKGTGQMYVNLSGRRHYLGKAGSPGVDEAYNRLLARWKAGGRQPLVSPDDITVVELIARFRTHAEVYYTPREVLNWVPALRELKRLFGSSPAARLDALALRSVRQTFVDRDCSRSYVNAQTTRLKRLFRWATSEGLIDGSKLAALMAVVGLKRNRTEARETDPVTPVPVAHLEAVRHAVNPTVRNMIDVQLATAARPGEVMAMRAVDIDTSGAVWIYTPTQHKNAHRGTRRDVYIGPRVQRILQPLMINRPVDGYLFPPAVDPRLCYSRSAYRQAILRGCDRAFPPPEGLSEDEIRDWRREHRWSPNQLRHNAASALRKEFGVEIARIICGHAKIDATQLYAERDQTKALEIALKIG